MINVRHGGAYAYFDILHLFVCGGIFVAYCESTRVGIKSIKAYFE